MADKDEFLKKIISDPNIVVLLNSIYDGVYIVNRDREILFWNKGAELITGHIRTEVERHKCSDNILNHIDENGNLLCNGNCPLTVSMKEDKNVEKKIYPLHKNQNRFPVITRIGPIKDNDGNIVGAIEVFRDVTREDEFRILQEKFNELIKKYVSISTYKEVESQAKNGKHLPAELCELTIIYVDVVGFSSFSLRNELSEIAGMLNDIFGLCEGITKKYHGDIDKFIGDAIMATFIDANDAVHAAEIILKELSLLNVERDLSGKEKINLHIGINSGIVIRAEIGTSERKDLTVLGDTVNIASHIQQLAHPGSIFISESTFSRLKNSSDFSFYDTLAVKGRNEPISVYKSDII
jgi:PAS domain S-box-containing protein